MRILQINCTYPGGSTGKIVADIHDYMKKKGHVSGIIYGIGKTNDLDAFCASPQVVRKLQSLRAKITGNLYGGCMISTYRVIRKIKRFRPDVVHLHCINAYMVNIYKLLDFLKKNGIATVITHHAEFLYTGGCSYTFDCNKWLTGCNHCQGKFEPKTWFFERSSEAWKRLQKVYCDYKKITHCGVSDWLRNRAKCSPFLVNQKVITVLNGINTTVFHYCAGRNEREILKIPKSTKVVLHVTPDFSSSIKGGKHVLEMAKRFQNEDVLFLVVGCKEGNLNDQAYREYTNLRMLGYTQNQQELAEYYSMSDICLLTSVRETFSMICAESLCCGTPVVGFEAGAPETISLSEYSEFVEQGNDDLLEQAIRRWLNCDIDHESICKVACKVYDRKRMCQDYEREYEQLLK
ncbi:MAG: glycosyltransferase [Lachnospiraceae bacterium]|nr:glycosyltransferase [Lachnospiraceae bacterium]